MNSPSTLWIWTPLFARHMLAAGRERESGGPFLEFRPDDSRSALMSFRDQARRLGSPRAVILDIAHFTGDTPWAYVSDGVNRSGINPLTGLGPLLQEAFPDLTRLYRVPAGSVGVEAVSLGSRYADAKSDDAFGEKDLVPCSFLHHAAILAHIEGFSVTGVLVAEVHVPHFDPAMIPAGRD